MKKILLIMVAVMAVNFLGCEGNTTGMYHHKPDHEDKPADQTNPENKQ